MSFLTALRFLTIVPLPGREPSPEEVGRSTGFFPMVGLFIGLILAGLNWLLSLLLPSAVVNGLLIVSLMVISGALHLDGFIDTCDGLAGHKTTKERWQIMSDSRVGAFGIIGVACLLLVKYVSLNSVPEPWLTTTLVLMPVASRWAMVYTIFSYPYARPSGLGTVFKQGAKWQQITLATVITIAVAVILMGPVGLLLMLGIWLVAAVAATFFRWKFSGLTGDTYGAINEITEVCFMLFIVLLAHNHWLVQFGGIVD